MIVLVWLLVTVNSSAYLNTITFPAQFADVESCERVKKAVNPSKPHWTQCIQVKVVK